MVNPTKPPANAFVRQMRKVYNPIGFSKGYNFILFFTFAGAFFGFGLSRLMYLDIPNTFCAVGKGSTAAAPGECFYYKGRFNAGKIGIRLHLYMIIPAALLAVFQFVPAIRHKVILFHRINGYLIILMVLLGNIGALMIARHAFNGGVEIQSFVGLLVILTTGGLALAIYNIKRLQIDQHRAWMLRTWFYFGTIVTQRLVMFFCAAIISNIGGYHTVQTCEKLLSVYTENKIDSTLLVQQYPACEAFVSGTASSAAAIVAANLNSDDVAEIMSALNVAFGMAGWIALALHAIGVEFYLHLTPVESDRLRQVSYQRQLEAGFKRPGNSGLTAQRLGDANAIDFEKHRVQSRDQAASKPQQWPQPPAAPVRELSGSSADTAVGGLGANEIKPGMVTQERKLSSGTESH